MNYWIMYMLVVAENTKEFFSGYWRGAFGLAGSVLICAVVLWHIIRAISHSEIRYRSEDGKQTQGWSANDEKAFADTAPKLRKMAIVFIVLSMGMSFLYSITPNMKQAAVIYIVPKVIENPNMRELPDNVLVLFNESIKELTHVVKGEATSIAKEVSEAAKEEAKRAIADAADMAKDAAADAKKAP